MKKIYFLLLAFSFLSTANAQNPSDIDPNFNQLNLPLKNYFVDGNVGKSKVLPDGKILLIKNYTLIRLDGNQLDTSFNTGTGFNDTSDMQGRAVLTDFAVQPDGKIIVGGHFNYYNGIKTISLIRLNQDGSLDTTFKFISGGYYIYAAKHIEVQADGKIIIVGDENNGSKNLSRLFSDGSTDKSFLPPNYNFGNIAIQSDGKYVVTHNSNTISATEFSKISRLNIDGSVDTSFSSAQLSGLYGGFVLSKKILIQNDGKIVIGGLFTGCNSTSSRDLVRLNTNGLVDTSLQIGSGFAGLLTNDFHWVNDIIQQMDGKLIVSGCFMMFNQVNRENIIRLNSDGSDDNSFVDLYSFLNFNSIDSISLFNDQKILASGSLDYNNKKQGNYIVKINSNGTRDASFNNIGKGFFRTTVNDVIQSADGKILVGGQFHSYNGLKCNGFTRLNYDGSVDNTLNYGGLNGFEGNNNGEITSIETTSDGKIYIGGSFSTFNGNPAGRIVRINPDGKKDTSFNIGEGFDYRTAYPGRINDIMSLPNGYVLVAGFFSTFGWYNRYGIVALDSQGNMAGFPDVGRYVNCLKKQNDGNVLIGSNGNTTVDAVLRFDVNSWKIDQSFVLDPLLKNGSVTSIAVQQDNKIILCGEFIINGIKKSLVRILYSGELDTSFDFTLQDDNNLVRNIALSPNQKIIIDLSNGFLSNSVHTIMRLNSDGAIDTKYNNIKPATSSPVQFYTQTDGKILIYGNLPNSKGNPGAGLNRLLGEDYNFISGQNKYDSTNNGCDINDNILKNLKMHIYSGGNSFDYTTNTTGNYNAALTNGTHTITPKLENPIYFNVSPTTVNVTFPTQTSPFTQNFCITPNGVRPDLEVTLIPLAPARPGFDAKYKLVYKNKGNTTQSGSVNLNFMDTVLDLVIANPVTSSQTAHNLSWNFTALQPFETREITFTMNVSSPMEIPAVNNGDILNFTTTITSSATEETPLDNTFTLSQTVVGSYDPNDKTCLEGSVITPALIGQYVHYLIRFENNGTANAQNIVVKDMIDLSKFDISTLVSTNASHSFVTNIFAGNKVEFIFENINLPFDDASNDGYIAFKIKTLPTLVVNDTFSNDASIYFDYNFPVVTKLASSTFKTLGTPDFEFSNYFTLYPNPAKSVLNISSKETIEVKSISIYNTFGQLVLVIPNAEKVSKIDVSSLTSGNYFIKINSDKGSSNARFVKE